VPRAIGIPVVSVPDLDYVNHWIGLFELVRSSEVSEEVVDAVETLQTGITER